MPIEEIVPLILIGLFLLVWGGTPVVAIVYGVIHHTRQDREDERRRLRENEWQLLWTPEMKKFLFGWFTDPVAISLSESPKLYKSYVDAWQEYVCAWRQKRVPELWAQILVGAHRAAYAETARIHQEAEGFRTKATPRRPPHRVHVEVVRPQRLLLPPAE